MLEGQSLKEQPQPTRAIGMSSAKWHSPLLRERLAARNCRGLFRNEAPQCAALLMREETARVDGRLCDDIGALLRGNAVYIRHFACDADDTRLYDRLKKELVKATGAKMSMDDGLIEWSRHEKFESPTWSATFNDIIEMLAEYFDIDVYATRLNYYRNGDQWKPQHHDSHAYASGDGSGANAGEGLREDFTVGITLGATRSLLFQHVTSGAKFDIPQRNGDCFAFTSIVNNAFTHGVPRMRKLIGDRFSIIAWGRRRTLNERNGGQPAGCSLQCMPDVGEIQTIDAAIQAAHLFVSRGLVDRKAQGEIPTGVDVTKVTNNVNNTNLVGAAPKKKKKNRLQ